MKSKQGSAAAGLFLALALAGPAVRPATSSMEYVRAALQHEKRALIVENLGLTAAEAAAFWPLYETYQDALAEVNERWFGLIDEFVAHYRDLSDERAEGLLAKYLAVQRDRLALKESYLARFRSVLPPRKLVALYQIENKIEAVVDYDLAERIPLAR